jgi:hypothetical protein
MKLFKCNHCGQPVYFENYFCVTCSASLGFDAQKIELVALKPSGDGSFTNYPGNVTDGLKSRKYKYCINKQYWVCNWLLPWESETKFCVACSLNRTIPT